MSSGGKIRRLGCLAIFLSLGFSGCAPPAIYWVYPRTVSSFGYSQVKIYGNNLLSPGVRVEVAGVPAIVDGMLGANCMRVTVQGGPQAGAADVVITTFGGQATLAADDPDHFTYAPSIDDERFARMAGLGASFGFGIQSMAAHPGYRVQYPSAIAEWVGGSLASPLAMIARQAGAYFPLPLVMKDGFPGFMQPSDVGYADPVTPDPQGSGVMGEYFTHPWTGESIWVPADSIFNPGERIPGFDSVDDFTQILGNLFAYYAANTLDYTDEIGLLRLSPRTHVNNVCVPTANLTEILHGARSGPSLLSYFSVAPETNLLESLAVGPSQVKTVIAGKPTVIISADLCGNSALSSNPRDDVFKVELLLTLLDLSIAAFLVDPESPTGAVGIPYIDIAPESGPIMHDLEHVKWSPFGIDWQAMPPELVPLLQAALQWLIDHNPDFGEWSFGWEYEDNLAADFTRLALPNGQPLATMADDANGDGWVDADELLPHLDRVFSADPDLTDNPYGIFVSELVDLGILGRSPGVRETGVRFNTYLYQIVTALNAAAPQPLVYIAPLYDDSRHWIEEDIQCGAPISYTDFNNDGLADFYVCMFGGMLSFDGLHLTNTGYALLANAFIGEINREWYQGRNAIPSIDMMSVLRHDYMAFSRFTDPRIHDWAESNYHAYCDPPSWYSDNLRLSYGSSAGRNAATSRKY